VGDPTYIWASQTEKRNLPKIQQSAKHPALGPSRKKRLREEGHARAVLEKGPRTGNPFAPKFNIDSMKKGVCLVRNCNHGGTEKKKHGTKSWFLARHDKIASKERRKKRMGTSKGGAHVEEQEPPSPHGEVLLGWLLLERARGKKTKM